MGKFTPTEKQEKAFKELEKAFIKARKTGLIFYGKGGSLVAYKKNADAYLNETDIEKVVCTGYDNVPYLSSSKCINDSGSDDFGCYRTKEDEEYYG